MIDLSFQISDSIDELMHQRGLTKNQFAVVLGRRPSEITKWLSGQHNFTIATLRMLSSFLAQRPVCFLKNNGLVMSHNTKINAIFVDIKTRHDSVLVYDSGF